MKDFLTGQTVTQEEMDQVTGGLMKQNAKPFLWYAMYKRVMVIELQVGPECKITGTWKNGFHNMKVKIDRFYNKTTAFWYERPVMLNEMYDCCMAPIAGFVPWPIMSWVGYLFTNHVTAEDMHMTRDVWTELYGTDKDGELKEDYNNEWLEDYIRERDI